MKIYKSGFENENQNYIVFFYYIIKYIQYPILTEISRKLYGKMFQTKVL